MPAQPLRMPLRFTFTAVGATVTRMADVNWWMRFQWKGSKRIDHMVADPDGRQLFVAALGSNGCENRCSA